MVAHTAQLAATSRTPDGQFCYQHEHQRLAQPDHQRQRALMGCACCAARLMQATIKWPWRWQISCSYPSARCPRRLTRSSRAKWRARTGTMCATFAPGLTPGGSYTPGSNAIPDPAGSPSAQFFVQARILAGLSGAVDLAGWLPGGEHLLLEPRGFTIHRAGRYPHQGEPGAGDPENIGDHPAGTHLRLPGFGGVAGGIVHPGGELLGIALSV